MRGHKKRAWGKSLRRLNRQGVTPIYFKNKYQKASAPKGGREGGKCRKDTQLSSTLLDCLESVASFYTTTVSGAITNSPKLYCTLSG